MFVKFDCHIHMVLDGVSWKAAIARHEAAPAEDFIRSTLQTYRERGYTYLRDGGDRWGAGKRARELSAEYGIRYRTPLAPLCKAGQYGTFIGEKYEDMRQYHQLVLKMKACGADFIKIMISGLMDFDQFGRLTQQGLPPAEIRELIHIAHEEGMAVMAHANGNATVEAAAMAGVESVEHGAYMQESALAAMAEMGTVWVPTLSAIGNLRGRGRFDETAVSAILDSALVNVEKFAHMGGRLACGSDAGAWAVPHGCDTEEALLFLALGEQTQQVLQRGNQTIAEKF